MDLKGLEYVVAVADAASFTTAAKNLFVAQPALSRKIAQIEREFGTEFFSRSGRQVQLTEAGQVFCRGARQILADCRRLEQDMDRQLHQVEPLRLIYLTDGELPFAANIVCSVHERYPNIEVYAQPLSSISTSAISFFQILELMRQRRLDVLFTFAPEVRDERLEWLGHKCVEPGGLCAFVTRGHPLYGKTSVRADELREYTLILPSTTYAPVLSHAVYRALGEPPRVVRSDSSTDFRVKIITGSYVGIMPASSRTIESRFLHCLDISDVSEGFDLEVAWDRENETEAMKKFLSIV